MKKLLRRDWDIIAGIAAAVLAIVLHLLHIVETSVVFTVVLVFLALLQFRDLRREGHDERLGELVAETRNAVEEVRQSVQPSDALLIGPRHLRAESRRFSETARGDMLWYNVCFLMFQTQDVFDLMLRPAIENPLVDSIQFIADESEKEHWETHVLPKIRDCDGHRKVREPRWSALPKTVSFILADVDAHGTTEALLSFWGEPFMARTTGQQVPRYIFRVRSHSDLIARLVELERQQRMGGGAS
ncbi:MAG: hypothetical protein WD069_19760 [Planctomycetales bacterium]